MWHTHSTHLHQFTATFLRAPQGFRNSTSLLLPRHRSAPSLHSVGLYSLSGPATRTRTEDQDLHRQLGRRQALCPAPLQGPGRKASHLPGAAPSGSGHECSIQKLLRRSLPEAFIRNGYRISANAFPASAETIVCLFFTVS